MWVTVVPPRLHPGAALAALMISAVGGAVGGLGQDAGVVRAENLIHIMRPGDIR
jgi:hypothetical protein